ncbi:hypothetical protein G9A89_004363 [Geosiphon pyriformis]|nr:hypothetical protein G9A89_004363 [Geosiphon pyriformis]
MVDVTGNIRKIEITDNIHSLAQQLFQLIQHQEMEITINQQTIRYQNTRKTLQPRTQKKTENMVDKIIAKNLYTDKTKQLFDKRILQQLEYFVRRNNLFTQTRAIYQIHTAFQNRPEILLNKTMDMVTSNQLGKITNAQFEELQAQITQVILENEIQEILQERELNELDFNGA